MGIPWPGKFLYVCGTWAPKRKQEDLDSRQNEGRLIFCEDLPIHPTNHGTLRLEHTTKQGGACVHIYIYN